MLVLKKNFRKLIYILALAGLFLSSAPAVKAQISVVSNPTVDPLIIKYLTVEPISKSIGASIAGGLLSGVSYFLNKLAYDTSTWIASGDYDEKPLFITDTAGYLANTGLDSIGETIGFISQNSEFLKKYKVNLCVPPDIRMQLWLKLAMFDVAEPKPRCSFESIKQAYSRLAEPGYWQNIGVGFTAGQNDLSTLNSIYGFSVEESLRKEVSEFQKMQTEGQAQPKKEAVSGKANTPAAVVDEEARANAPSRLAQDVKQNISDAKNALALGNIGATFANAGSMFVNNLASKAMQKLLQIGFISIFGQPSNQLETLELGNLQNMEYQYSGSGRANAENAFAGYLITIASPVDSYNYVGELADCSGRNSALSCTIDAGLQAAISQAQVGDPMTIAEAIAKKLLHGSAGDDWVLYGDGYPPDGTLDDRSLAKNTSANCANDAYCYSNLVKLRFLRVLPLGFEIAAKTFPGTTLKAVVDGFNDCPSGRFCHLIDPDWVIKAPVARCGNETFGPLVEAGTGQRSKYCADVQNCINEDASGNCVGERNWGYCLREKNIWRLGGDACDAQYNTCTLYTSRLGKQASYLANTVDRRVCTAQNAGCRGYSIIPKQPDFVGWNPSNPDYYFNKSVETCDSGNEGCSRFVRTAGNVAGEGLYLKKAPQYFGCYGEKVALSGDADGIKSWPTNKADLYNVFSSWSDKVKTECGRFANVCTAEEEGCQMYKPEDGSASVPGIISVNDLCPAECAGYAKYVEASLSMFSNTSEAYFINSTANACQPVNVGCSEFVNLDSAAGGGEQKQYFSQLRLCSKNAADGAVFYTWEGSDTAGYQLKSYNLKKAGDGTPDSIVAIDAGYLSQCSATVYKTPTAVADCREFYDKDGNKSYRLYAKTITVDSANCQTYRLGNAAQTTCVAPGKWDDARGCLYDTIVAEGRTCPAEQNNCRAYRGNAGNNFQTILSDNYENKKPGQSDGGNQYSAESLNQGGVSLKVTTGVMSSGASQVENGQYIITFWAKGNKGDLTVSVYPEGGSPRADTQQTVALGTDWATYSVGPVNIDWNPAKTVFKVENKAGLFFFDNIVVKKMTDNIYVIKDSWVTPSSCDNLLGDSYGATQGGTAQNPLRLLPQAHLGCANYTDLNKSKVTLKSFTSMCREEAVGCEKVLDTFNVGSNNTKTSAPTTVNALCRLSGVDTGINKTNQAVPCLDKTNTERCLVAPNERECKFIYTGDDSGANDAGVYKFDKLTGGETQDSAGTVYATLVGRDAQSIILPSAKEVYLVNNEKSRCDTQNLGCQAFGLVEYKENNAITADKTVYLKNQPDKYGDIFCTAEAERCEEFRNSKGGSEYFKDPAINQNKLCEWKDSITRPTPEPPIPGGWVKKGTENTPCNPSSYKIYTAGSVTPKYEGMVGTCPANQDTCSEFIDPQDTSPDHPAGWPYFVLNNNKLDRTTCNSVSKKKGCVLFNETSKGAVYWNTEATYADSESKNSDLVNPSTSGTKDSNIILKVKRDRKCGEWLSCSGYTPSFMDSDSGEIKRLCTALSRCDKSANTAITLDNICGDEAVTNYYSKKPLSLSIYKARDTTWKSGDYSGYTVPFQYSMEELSSVNLGEGNNADWRLVKQIPCGGKNCGETCIVGANDWPACKNWAVCKTETASCGANDEGVCVKQNCVVAPDNTKNLVNQELQSAPSYGCRASYEATAPFPNFKETVRMSAYEQVNFCQKGIIGEEGFVNAAESDSLALACECNYTKMIFGGALIKYDGYTPSTNWKSVCQGGGQSGKPGSALCVTEGGSNILLSNQSRVMGMPGVCAQYDLSKNLYGRQNIHPCLVWLPVGQLTGSADLNNQFRDAGFKSNYTPFGPFYCVENERWEYRPGYDVEEVGFSGGADFSLASFEAQMCAPGYTAHEIQASFGFVKVNCAPANGVGWYYDPFPPGTLNEDYVILTYKTYDPAFGGNCCNEVPMSCGSMQVCEPRPAGGHPHPVTGEKEEKRCEKMYQPISDNPVIGNKAKTQYLWTLSNGQMKAADRGSRNCGPGDALSVDTLPPVDAINGLTSITNEGGSCSIGHEKISATHPEEYLTYQQEIKMSPSTMSEPLIFDQGGKTTLIAINQMFAKLYAVYEYTGVPTMVKMVNMMKLIVPQVLPPDSSDIGKPPTLLEVDYSKIRPEDFKYGEGQAGNFTVNKNIGNNPREPVVVRSGTTPVTIEFFVYADNNQMPLRDMVINDGFETNIYESTGNYYKNSRGQVLDSENKLVDICDSDENKVSEFGKILGRTCSNDPVSVVQIYRCGDTELNKLTTCTGATPETYNTPCKHDFVTADGQKILACYFKPKIQVKDNWGWCNGTCPGHANGGCYDYSDSGGDNECDTDGFYDHWTYFKGVVIVLPND